MRRALAPSYRLRAHRAQADSVVFYDSFEWQLWFSGRVLCRRGDRLTLARREQDWIGTTERTCSLPGAMPRFPRALPDRPMADALASLAGLRALLPVAEIGTSERSLDILDDQAKTVVRAQLLVLHAGEGGRSPFFRLLRFSPLRGYTRELDEVAARLRSLGATPIEQGPLAVWFERIGRVPVPYTLRPAVGLRRETPAREAIRLLVRAHLEIARRNEPGILEDLDTEFLHDYRICIRKIRSALGLIKGVFPDDRTRELRDKFGDFTRATNRLRDLDVHLLAHDEWAERLPEALHPGLEQLTVDLQALTRSEKTRLARHLRSASYRRRVESLMRLVSEPDTMEPSESSALPIGRLVAKAVKARFDRIRRAHRRLDATTPPAELHRLRLACKKLRYLLELFRELFAEEDLERVTRPLRRLQNRLGDFNDCAVQQTFLLAHLAEKEEAGTASSDLALAVGGMAAVLSLRQRRDRRRVGKDLDRFCTDEVHEVLAQMTAAAGGAEA